MFPELNRPVPNSHQASKSKIKSKSQCESPPTFVDHWTISHDGQVLYLAYRDSEVGNHDIEQWRIDGSENSGLMQRNEIPVNAMVISPDGKVLATTTASKEGYLKLWEPSTHTELFSTEL